MTDHFIAISFKTDETQTAILEALIMEMGGEGIEEKDNGTTAYIRENSFKEDELKLVFKKFKVPFTTERIAQQNWNAEWERSFDPVQVNNFAAIRATFHPPIPGVLHDIIITPKMSFGTGHHATTFLMIQEMQALYFKDHSVIDFGTGTAVLAILAEKLGASEILAIDNDDWSINNAIENMTANHCNKIVLQKGEEMSTSKKAAIILANINLNVIIANIARIKEVCLPETKVLLSGLLLQDEPQISEVLTSNGFQIVKCVNKNNWMAILATLA
jgi:ribosomal protein L11 methyltransferase